MQPRTALLVTYTMAAPAAAVGVFFRALRLSHELSRRGWACVICNNGAIPSDPKVDAATGVAEIIRFEGGDAGDDFRRGLSLFRDIAPRGDPASANTRCRSSSRCSSPSRALVTAADRDARAVLQPRGRRPAGRRRLPPHVRPPVAVARRRDCGTAAFAVVPPFIEHVAAARELPIPAGWHGRPMLTILGFDAAVLRGGLEVFARLQSTRPSR